MSNRTFCVLLASLMLLTAAAARMMLQAGGEKVEGGSIEALGNAAASEQQIAYPVDGEVCGVFGMNYSESLKQWSMRETMEFAIGQRQTVCAPLSGMIKEIRGLEGGGCSISVVCGEVCITLWPVYEVRVFEGSAVEQSDAIGTASDFLQMEAFLKGERINPMAVEISGTF